MAETPERWITEAVAAEIATQFSEAMRNDLRVQLLAFATWLLEGEGGARQRRRLTDE